MTIQEVMKQRMKLGEDAWIAKQLLTKGYCFKHQTIFYKVEGEDRYECLYCENEKFEEKIKKNIQ